MNISIHFQILRIVLIYKIKKLHLTRLLHLAEVLKSQAYSVRNILLYCTEQKKCRSAYNTHDVDTIYILYYYIINYKS